MTQVKYVDMCVHKEKTLAVFVLISVGARTS